MKYCFYCGSMLEDNDTFCLNCGNVQEGEKETSTGNENSYSGKTQFENAPKSNNTTITNDTESCTGQSTNNGTEKGRFKVAGVVGAMIVLIIIVVFFIVFNSNGIGESSYSEDDYGYEDEYGYDAAYLGDYGYDEYADDFYFYDSSSRYLTYDEVSYLDEEECQYAINEIYARHGRKFSEEPYVSYFNSCEWYQPIYSGDDFDESVFNDYEIENLVLLADYRKELEEEYDY